MASDRSMRLPTSQASITGPATDRHAPAPAPAAGHMTRRMPSPLPATAFAAFGGSPVRASPVKPSPLKARQAQVPPRMPVGPCPSPPSARTSTWRQLPPRSPPPPPRSPVPRSPPLCSPEQSPTAVFSPTKQNGTRRHDSVEFTPQPRHLNATFGALVANAEPASQQPRANSTIPLSTPPQPDQLALRAERANNTGDGPRAQCAPPQPDQLALRAERANNNTGGGLRAQCIPPQPDQLTLRLERANNTGGGPRAQCTRFSSSSPARKKLLCGAAEPVRVLGVGAGGILELGQEVNDRMVSYALLRFQVGGGTFLRTKLVAIHFNGEDTPLMLRGWLNGRRAEVLSMLGEVHANIDVTRSKDLTVQNLCERLLPLFAADNLVLSLATLNEEYGKVVEQMQMEARQRRLEAAAAARQPVMPATPRDATEAIKAVSAERGPCNWALLEPRSLKLHSCGLGGLEDLKAHLAEDMVLFGLLRLTFGCGNRDAARSAPGITKHVFVHWVGPRVSVVQRGMLNARLGAACSKCCAVAFRREAHCLGDLKLEDIVAELRRLTVVDGIAAADGIAAGRICAAEYLAALKEETTQATQQPEWEAEPETGKPPKIVVDVKTAISKVRCPDGEWNWVLCGWDNPEACKLQPPPSRGGA